MAEVKEERDSPGVDLLHPELLSKKDLIKILELRGVNNGDLGSQEKTKLLILFHEFIVPQPQRVYRENRRGRIMNKERETQEAKREAETEKNDKEKPGKHKASTHNDEPKSKHARITFEDSKSSSRDRHHSNSSPPDKSSGRRENSGNKSRENVIGLINKTLQSSSRGESSSHERSVHSRSFYDNSSHSRSSYGRSSHGRSSHGQDHPNKHQKITWP